MSLSRDIPIIPRQRRTVWPVAFAVLLSSVISGSKPNSCHASHPRDSAPSIARLLESLDADSYQDRERAAEQLIKHGETALKAMALHSFASSPESAWRIRSIIEQIGTAGSENTFYKSTGVLRLLYPLDDERMSQRGEELRRQWQLARKKKAIAELRNLGATISDPVGDELATAAPQGWPMANGGRVIVNGRILNQTQVVTADTRTRKKNTSASIQRRKSLTQRELIKEVDELLASDLATNRDRILGEDDGEANGPASAANTSGLNNRFPRLVSSNQFRLGVVVLLSDAFRGSADDLKQLQNIPNVTLVHWKGRDLDRAELEAAHAMGSVRRVHLENCRFPEAPLPKSAWPRLATHYEFVEQQIPVAMMQQLRSSGVNSLKFSKCGMSQELHRDLQKINSLRQIGLEEMRVDDAWFQTFASTKSLTRVDLSLCKFDSDNYRQLKKQRPKLVIAFTPGAFLGIRSLEDDANVRRARMIARMRAAAKANPQQKLEAPQFELPPSEGCEISQVVAGSGAEKAGLLPGDVIKKINGTPIRIFEDIRLIVAQHRSGEKLEVEVERDGKPKNMTVQLSNFPKAAIE